MKKLSAFVFAVAICALGNAQDLDTHVKDGRVVYQHVFEGVIENPLETIENWPGVDNVRDLDGAFFADVTIRESDVKRVSPELGLNWGNTMIFLRTAINTGQLQIQVKEGRYRVAASDFVVKHTSPSGPLAGRVDAIEVYCVKKNGDTRVEKFRQTKLVYDAILNEVCSGKTRPLIDPSDDW